MTDFAASPYWSPMRDQYSDRREEILFWAETGGLLIPQWQAAGATRLLDAGSGTGRMVEALVGLGWDATGITYQASEVAAFDQRCPLLAGRLQVADLHAIPYPDNTFDVVVCWDVLEHTLAPLHVLGELRRVTKPDGHLLVFIPGSYWIGCPYHILVPTQRQMVHLLYLADWYIETVYDGSPVQAESGVYVASKRAEIPKMYDVRLVPLAPAGAIP